MIELQLRFLKNFSVIINIIVTVWRPKMSGFLLQKFFLSSGCSNIKWEKMLLGFTKGLLEEFDSVGIFSMKVMLDYNKKVSHIYIRL